MSIACPVILVGLAASALIASGATAQGPIGDPLGFVQVNPDGDAKAFIAVSVYGNATGDDLPIVGSCVGCPDPGVAVSVFGKAGGRTTLALSGFGNASCRAPCAAVSLFGNTTACHLEANPCVVASGTGDADVQCISLCAAVSGTGNAQCENAFPELVPCVAVSATGHASGGVAVGGCDALTALGRPELCGSPV